jgi:RecQ family ATP-dependent DNA helicase
MMIDKELGQLKVNYPRVPLMALTATANEKVKVDVKVNLRIPNCLEFAMSFNRPNLIYEVVPKTRSIDEDIVKMIRERWKGRSGIIYCTSKKKCEDCAETLSKDFNISAKYYHAGLEKEDRSRIQNEWASNQIQIIVATVAFGMGIDKPDVRFVIHYSLPQSIEGYYQETGRAGRDGNLSHCILFYTYRDKSTIEFLIEKGEGHYQQKERQRENLRQMIMFCENKTDCRRRQLLSVCLYSHCCDNSLH